MKKILKDLQENIELYFISAFVIVFFVWLAYIAYVDLIDIKNEKPNQNIEITEVTQVIETIEEMAEPIRPFYVEDYATEEEIEMIAKVLYREARGVKDKDQIAAVAWCILAIISISSSVA